MLMHRTEEADPQVQLLGKVKEQLLRIRNKISHRADNHVYLTVIRLERKSGFGGKIMYEMICCVVVNTRGNSTLISEFVPYASNSDYSTFKVKSPSTVEALIDEPFRYWDRLTVSKSGRIGRQDGRIKQHATDQVWMKLENTSEDDLWATKISLLEQLDGKLTGVQFSAEYELCNLSGCNGSVFYFPVVVYEPRRTGVFELTYAREGGYDVLLGDDIMSRNEFVHMYEHLYSLACDKENLDEQARIMEKKRIVEDGDDARKSKKRRMAGGRFIKRI